MSEHGQPFGALTSGDWSQLEQIVDRFENAWLSGSEPVIEEFLPPQAAFRHPLLVELIHTDLECRLKAGRIIRVESYLERFQEISSQVTVVLDLILAEYNLRLRGEPDVTIAEYLERFPQFAGELESKIICPGHAGDSAPHFQLNTVGNSSQEAIDPRMDSILPHQQDQAASGRYQPMTFHAKGGLGEVYKAQDSELNRQVALKRIKSPLAEDSDCRRRFLQEAEITGRLEHPGIVPVYGLVRDANGRPSYAMRFIQGDTLHQAIKDYHGNPFHQSTGGRSLAFRQLLNRFVVVCNTIAYAHSRGVLHRDIKPANIMLGKYGETLVVDWGLAKELVDSGQRAVDNKAEVDREQRAVDGNAKVDSDEIADCRQGATIGAEKTGSGSSLEQAAIGLTAEGQVLGTPAFMSPEQAAGNWEKVGPASDIYSLGATLYTILTGNPPYLGEPRAVLALVRQGCFISPRTGQKSIPRALEAICLKAMALLPENRYPSALDLAADLEHWLADQPVTAYREPAWTRLGRWARRNKPLVTGAAALLVTAVVALSISNILLDEERQRTERNRQQAVKARDEAKQSAQSARDLFNEALGAYRTLVFEVNRKLRDTFATHRLKQNLLQTALRGLNRLAQSARQVGEADNSMSWAHMQMGDIYMLVGSTRKAEEHFRIGYQIADKLRIIKATDLEAIRTWGHAAGKVGYVRLRLGKSNVEKYYRQALDSAQRLHQEDKRNITYVDDLAMALSNLGSLYLERGKRAEAREYCQVSLRYWQDVVKARPDKFDYERELGVVFSKLANIANQTKEYPLAEMYARKAIHITGKLAQARPFNAEMIRDQAMALDGLGDVKLLKKENSAALASYREALPYWQTLARIDPENARVQRDLAVCLGKLANASEATGQKHAARSYWLQSLPIKVKLGKNDPHNTLNQGDLGLAYFSLGTLSKDLGDLAAAERYLRQAIPWFERLTGKKSLAKQYYSLLALTYLNLGAVGLKRKLPDDARRYYLLALKIYEHQKKSPARRAQAHIGLVMVYDRLGDAREKAGQLREAEDLYRQALVMARAIMQYDDKEPQFLRALSQVYRKLGHLKVALSVPNDARQHFLQALATAQKWVTRRPKDQEALDNLATSLERLGDLAFENEGSANALPWHLRALPVREKLLAHQPASVSARWRLARVLERLGSIHAHRQNWSEAAKHYQRCLELRDSLIKQDAKNVKYQLGLAIVNDGLGTICLGKQDFDAARRYFRLALIMRENLLKEHARDPSVLRDLYVSYYKIGRFYRKSGDLNQAESYFIKAAASSARTVELKPSQRSYRDDLAKANEELGDCRYEAGQFKSALAAFRQSLDQRTLLARLAPGQDNPKRHLVMVYDRLGRTCRKVKEIAQAKTYLNLALALAEPLAKSHPKNVSDQQFHLTIWQRLADLALDENDGIHASLCQRKALAIALPLARNNPKNARILHDVSACYIGLGNAAHLQSRRSAERDWFRQALGWLEKAVQADPSRFDYLKDLASLSVEIATLSVQMTDYEVAIREGNRGRNLWAQLIKSGRYQREAAQSLIRVYAGLWVAYDHLGDARGKQQKNIEALHLHRQASQIADLYHRSDPKQPLTLTSLFGSHYKLGELLLKMDRKKEARQEYHQALLAMTEFVKRKKTGLQGQGALAELCRHLGDLSLQLQDTSAARKYYAQALPPLEIMARGKVADIKTVGRLINAYFRAGDLAIKFSNYRQARDYYFKAVQAGETLAKAHPKASSALWHHYLSLDRFARASLDLGEAAAARTAYQKALTIAQTLAQTQKQDVLRRNLIVLNEGIAKASIPLGDHATARQYYHQAVLLCQQYLKDKLNHRPTQHRLAKNYGKLAEICQKLKDPDAALTSFRHCVKWLETLHQAEPGNLAIEAQLVLRYLDLGILENREFNYEQAQICLEKLIPLMRRLAKNDKIPDRATLANRVPVFEKALATIKDNLEAVKDINFALKKPPEKANLLLVARATVLAKKGNVTQARATIAKLAALPSKDGLNLYNAACCFGRWTKFLSRGKKPEQLLPAEKKDIEAFSREAINLLEKAKTAKFFDKPANVELIKKDPDLNPLRSRKEFMQFLANLTQAN